MTIPVSGFNLINLLVYTVIVNSDGGSSTYFLKPEQKLKDIQVNNNSGVYR